MLNVINYGFVLFFGITLSFIFAEIPFRNNQKHYITALCGFSLLQLITFFSLGEDVLYKSYPVLIHLPLFLLLWRYYKKDIYIAGICVLSAYLFCTPRKWIGTLVAAFFHGSRQVADFTEILITIPLLFPITKYISPYVARLKSESRKVLKLFIILPAIYYILEYFFTVYTDLLYDGGPVLVEFMDAFIVILYFTLSVVCLKIFYEKQELEIQELLLQTMTAQAGTEIEVLRKAERKSAIYRHDLRHHMNYLNSCIMENRLAEAVDYIKQTCSEIDNTMIIPYSDNEPVNLILASYAGKAKEKDIPITIEVTAADFSRFQITDLCSLLSNALENALHACEQAESSSGPFIHLRMFEKRNKLCLMLRNSYNKEPVFEQGIPVSHNEGHGIGVKSIAYVVEKYHGVYDFSAEDGIFTFQMTM